MQLVIADTGPINYLVLIGHIDVLPALFQKVILPTMVRDELLDAPPVVRDWVAAAPPWIELRTVTYVRDVSARNLDADEAAAITLALELHADLLLMDDREGVVAARYGLLDLRAAFDRLKRTNFRYRQEILDALLNEIEGTNHGTV